MAVGRRDLMKPTRRSQPYRKGRPRPAGRALGNMQRGRTVYGTNPKDVERLAQKRLARKRKRRRRRAVR